MKTERKRPDVMTYGRYNDPVVAMRVMQLLMDFGFRQPFMEGTWGGSDTWTVKYYLKPCYVVRGSLT